MEYFKNSIKNSFYTDTRTLALFRIVLGFLGMWDILRRYYLIDAFYSLEGINFRKQLTSNLSVKYFTLLDTFQTSIEVHLFFIAAFICFFFLMIGYRTRLFQLLSAIGLISIHNAAVILENGGDMVFNNYLIWTLFLPLGRSWSVDSLRLSLKTFPEKDSHDLNQSLPDPRNKIFHFAYIVCLIQLAMIYYYNYINKTGTMWSDGTAVYYMYQLDTFLTPLGVWIRDHLTIKLSILLTKMTLIIEHFGPIFILSPLFQPWLRRITFVLFMGFHLIIGISVGIGLFSWIMMAVLLLLLSREDINFIKRKIQTLFDNKYIVFYDRDCGFCHLTARIIKRLDVFNRITWADKLYEGEKPPNLLKTLETSLIVWNPETQEEWTRHKGFSKILNSLPFGFCISWILLIPGLEKLFGFMYDQISQNRTNISVTMGLAACGIKQNDIEINSPEPLQNPLINQGRKVVWIFSNILVVCLLIGAIDYSRQINEGLTSKKGKKELLVQKPNSNVMLKKIRIKIKRALLYPRMYQQWNMFAPSVIKSEKWVMGEIAFTNGEKISLFNTNNDIEQKFNRDYLPPYQEQFWRKLFGRLNKTSYKKYVPAFKEWLTETTFFSQYKGREVKNVTLWQLSERSLKPGSNKTSIVRKTEIVPGFKTNLTRRKKNSLKKNNRGILKKK